ncbi:MAG TPA: DNA polymerase III subunit beta [Lentisphaeria bacterium]|nr:MAG: hypothetical protein A2X47_00755 [Lentisphaerae bacterium GWF2_38_69]HBM16824.1 DNA polymerase III subunit beta [Lentisphaeria bacterium]
MDINQDTLQEIKNRLISVYKPETIYLFGSYAWGNPDKNSDVDLAVIVEKSNEKSYRRTQSGALALWDIKLPIDLLVYTRDEFNEKLTTALFFNTKERLFMKPHEEWLTKAENMIFLRQKF